MTKINDEGLRIVFFGDIVGRPGRQGVVKVLAEIKQNFKPDLVIGNIENRAHGKGVTPKTLTEMTDAGVQVFTSGEHIYDKVSPERINELFVAFPTLLKPANFSPDRPGRGEVIFDTAKGKVLVISLIGQVFFRAINLSPWTMLPEILERYAREKLAAVILDFHAEATSEKVALGQYFDGKISALFGTHTHIPTADAAILPGGTAYVTDVGMNGPIPSVLGMKSERSIERFLTGTMVPYDIAESDKVSLNYIEATFDVKSSKALKIEHKHQVIFI